MSLDNIPNYLVPISTTTYEIVGTPYTVDVISGPGRYRYYKTTKINTPYFSEEVRVDFEEVFDPGVRETIKIRRRHFDRILSGKII